jgi:FixJ family two-component response regulator
MSKVMIVDDMVSIRKMVIFALESEGLGVGIYGH